METRRAGKKYLGNATITVSVTTEKQYSVCEYQTSFTLATPSVKRRNDVIIHNNDDDTDVEDDDEFLEYSEVTFDKTAIKINDDHAQYKPKIPVVSKPHNCVKSSQCRSLCALTYNQHRSRKKTLKEFVESKARLHEDISENNSSIGTPNRQGSQVFMYIWYIKFQSKNTTYDYQYLSKFEDNDCI